ncbi:10939_t:CDS:2 [Acaulospora morrowiae]|uniref:10939_t:CDS:1 n=1 Tax=Acaulospora morrowiae TaxID=94023 RepID=A0A9N8WH27_9GLOM|nr:10939_t:CDS:2 [Acaulospora morrowiae]
MVLQIQYADQQQSTKPYPLNATYISFNEALIFEFDRPSETELTIRLWDSRNGPEGRVGEAKTKFRNWGKDHKATVGLFKDQKLIGDLKMNFYPLANTNESPRKYFKFDSMNGETIGALLIDDIKSFSKELNRRGTTFEFEMKSSTQASLYNRDSKYPIVCLKMFAHPQSIISISYKSRDVVVAEAEFDFRGENDGKCWKELTEKGSTEVLNISFKKNNVTHGRISFKMSFHRILFLEEHLSKKKSFTSFPSLSNHSTFPNNKLKSPPIQIPRSDTYPIKNQGTLAGLSYERKPRATLEYPHRDGNIENRPGLDSHKNSNICSSPEYMSSSPQEILGSSPSIHTSLSRTSSKHTLSDNSEDSPISEKVCLKYIVDVEIKSFRGSRRRCRTFRGSHEANEKPVIIKIYPKEWKALWRNEINMIKKLKSSYLVEWEDAEESSVGFIFVFNYHGKTLGSEILEIVKKKSLIKCVLMNTLLGIMYLHEHDVVHLNINPNNVWLQKKPESYEVRISDFDSAREVDTVIKNEDGLPRTLGYSAPEIFYDGYKVHFSADVFSFGALMYYIYTDGRKRIYQSLGDLRVLENKTLKEPLMEVEDTNASHLMEKMLTMTPKNRLTFQDILDDEYFQSSNITSPFLR